MNQVDKFGSWKSGKPDVVSLRQDAAEPWRMRLLTNDKNVPIANLANALLFMRHDSRLQFIVARDEMRRQIIVHHPIPGVEYVTAFEPHLLRDCDVTWVQEYIQISTNMPRIGLDTIFQAMQARAFECNYHPVRDYLKSLQWDSTPRVSKWLSYYLGVEPSSYASEVGKMFLVSMIARIFEPGCKCDYAMVLEGEQGARKSTACAIIGGDWFGDHLPDIQGGKDVSQYLNGKWVVEISELSSLDKAEANALKAFITRTVEQYRPSYGRNEVSEPRQCVFIGTTNKSAYLRDDTGGRRFWPVKVGTIDTDALANDRQQLLAEAVHLFNAGVKWWPDGEFEKEHIAPQQEERFQSDAWEEAISKYIAGDDSVSGDPLVKTTLLQVAQNALNIDKARFDRQAQLRITSILNRLGWFQGKRTNSGRYYSKHV